MIAALINIVIYLLILGCLYAILEYAIANLIPDPPARILRVVLVVVIGLVAVLLLLGLLGIGGGGVDLPKIAS